MTHSGAKITVDAAMRARDVSREQPDPPAPPAQATPRPLRKGERRRLVKRAARRAADQPEEGGAGS